MINIYRIWVNGLPYMGEDPEKTYESGNPWGSGFSQSHKFQANILVFGHITNDQPKPIVGETSLKSELDRIIRRRQDGMIDLFGIKIISEEALKGGAA